MEERFEKKHSGKTIFLSSLITNVRPFMALIVGSLKTPIKKFILLNLLGISIWATSVVSLGYFFGHHAKEFIHEYWPFFIAILFGSIIGITLKKNY